jgi:ribonuclease Z
VKLHFLGTTGYHPNNQRQTACLMLPELGVVLDAGTGIFRVRDLIQTSTLDIFLTHAHLDHSIGLTYLYDVLYQRNVERVTVHVAEDKIETICQQLFAFNLFPVKPNFEFSPLCADQEMEIRGGKKPIRLTTIPVDHPGGCLAFRLDGFPTGSLAYVTDTTASTTAPYVKAIEGVQILVHECYFPDGWEDRAALTGHSCLTPVVKVAQAAKAGCCYLVHASPLLEDDPPFDLEAVKSIYPNLRFASDHDVIEL